jgi:hypothetical protein
MFGCMILLRIGAAALLACAFSSANAWYATGHMVIADIAEHGLTARARLECERLLKPDDFISASYWADDIRRERPHTAGWHFINLHFRTDGKKVVNKPEKQNVVATIRTMTEVLRDKKKPNLERADALRYLIHFVGDVHQPLHTSTRDSVEFPKGDRGGNDHKIIPPLILSKQSWPPANLHALWDQGAGLFPDLERPNSPESRRLVFLQASTLMAALPRALFHKETDPMKWVIEGHRIARAKLYTVRANTRPSVAYIAMAKSVSARQATLAGYRLADLLNANL